MKEKIVEVQGIEVKMMKMPVVSALSLWDDLIDIFKNSAKDIELDLSSLSLDGDLDISKLIVGAVSAMGNGNLSKIMNSSIKHIHISDKNISSLDQLTARLESLNPEIDTLSFIDDFIIEFLKYQYEKKIMNLTSKIGLVLNKDTIEKISQSDLTGESGE